MKRKMFEVRNLSYRYPDGKHALDNVSFDVFEGETLGIVGANGAGKTTLLLHLNGILQTPGAHIRVMDMEVHPRHLRTIRSKVGFVFQNPDDQLFSPTVFEDVAFGPMNFGLSHEQVHRRVAETLAQIGMSGFEKRVSHHLSSGEKKKISIATVLSLPCEVLVLDEPTSNLDPRSRKNITVLLQRLPHTKVIASHDIELLVRICSRVIVLDAGKITADGTVESVFSDEEFLIKQGLY